MTDIFSWLNNFAFNCYFDLDSRITAKHSKCHVFVWKMRHVFVWKMWQMLWRTLDKAQITWLCHCHGIQGIREVLVTSQRNQRCVKAHACIHVYKVNIPRNYSVLEPVSPETQATNKHFQNYQKWSRFNGNYQNRRTSIFWWLVLSTKIEAACVQIFRTVSGTNGDGIWWHDGDGDVSITE